MKPAIRFSSVLLPQPEGPMMPTNSPRLGWSSMRKVMSVMAVKSPKRWVTFLNSTIGGSAGEAGVFGAIVAVVSGILTSPIWEQVVSSQLPQPIRQPRDQRDHDDDQINMLTR